MAKDVADENKTNNGEQVANTRSSWPWASVGLEAKEIMKELTE